MSSGWQLTWLFKLFALSSDLAILFLKIYPKKQNNKIKQKKLNKDTLKDLLEEGSSKHPF